jgi:hypothetical protein
MRVPRQININEWLDTINGIDLDVLGESRQNELTEAIGWMTGTYYVLFTIQLTDLPIVAQVAQVENSDIDWNEDAATYGATLLEALTAAADRLQGKGKATSNATSHPQIKNLSRWDSRSVNF